LAKRVIPELLMSRTIGILPGVAAFLAGVAAGVLTGGGRREGGGADPAATQELKRALASLETKIAAQESASTGRFAQIELRLEEHATKLADVPSTSQIVAAMEQLLTKTMSSLDDRLTSQARSIDTLRTTVAQTDSLLERVLESLDSLQTFTDPSEFAEDSLLHQLPV
jgi:uncharacterized coiled-coil protein SlyX